MYHSLRVGTEPLTVRIERFEAQIRDVESRLATLTWRHDEAVWRLRYLSHSRQSTRPALIEDRSHGVDDGEYISFSEWQERKTRRGSEDGF